MPRLRTISPWFVWVPFLVCGGCDMAYPEVIVVNSTGEHILLRNLSYNGCLWEETLAYGEASSPGDCLPGEARVHFQRLNGYDYAVELAENGSVDGVICDPEREDVCSGDLGEMAVGLVNDEPLWFNYQSLRVLKTDYGDSVRFEVTLDDMEQDFSVPGPYGH